MTERRPVDTEKVRRKIQVIRDALKKLEAIRREGPERFRANPFLEPAATRLLQVAIEALIDIANHIVAREGLGVPGTYRDALRLLVREGILDREDEPRFFAMVGFRNRAVHLYEEVDADQVYDILEKHLGDFERFIAAVTRRYFN